MVIPSDYATASTADSNDKQLKAIGGSYCCGFNAFYRMSKFNLVPKIWPI